MKFYSKPQHFQQFFAITSDLKKLVNVIPSVVVEHVGMEVPVKFVASTSKHSRDIQAAQFVMDERR